MKLVCKQCNKEFDRSAKDYGKSNKNHFCSSDCWNDFQRRHREVRYCKLCNKEIITRKFENKSFCSKSCAATFNNKNKKIGTRRSKLEVFIELELTRLFPQLEIVFNSKEVIGSELDVYIPSLLLAFELNGIFHYEPIFGINKLESIKINDKNKIIECYKRGIDLCVIDTSSLTYFKEVKAKRFLNIILDIIEKRGRDLNP